MMALALCEPSIGTKTRSATCALLSAIRSSPIYILSFFGTLTGRRVPVYGPTPTRWLPRPSPEFHPPSATIPR